MVTTGLPLLVLLPGTDGTGTFFAPLLAALGPEVHARIVAYPQTGSQAYETLGRSILAHLPAHEDYVLVGESFGGPLAIWLAARAPRRPVKLVLGATFAASPFGLPGRFVQPVLGLANWLPLHASEINMILFNGQSRETARWVHDTVGPIDRGILLDRVRSVLGCDMRALAAELEMPILCLNAARDRLVWPWLPRHFPRLPNLRIVDLDLPHMIFQSDPDGIARNILLPFLRS